MTQRTIHVPLLDEGTSVWRPVVAEELGDGLFRIVAQNQNAKDERWEFPAGCVVRCEIRRLSGGRVLVAVARGTP